MIRFRGNNADSIELNSQISYQDTLSALRTEVSSACTKSVWYEIFTNGQNEGRCADACMRKARTLFDPLDTIKEE